MLKKLKELIRKNDRLYVIAKCILNNNDPNLFKLLNGYYEKNSNFLPLLITNCKELENTNELVYMIRYGCDDVCTRGFGSLLMHTLIELEFSMLIKCTPLVIWGKNTRYYDEELEPYTKNAFTYFFETVSDISDVDIPKSYILMDNRHLFLNHNGVHYNATDDDIEYYASLFKKFIVLNKETEKYLYNQMKKIFVGNKILGIHARGTDFKVGYVNHPTAVTSNMYIEKAKELFDNGKYDYLFLATEDLNLLNEFIAKFGNKLVYYDDVFRTSGFKGPHSMENERSLHHYKLGLEILRDIYTLACCDSLICGMSKVSITARYINRALEKNYDEFVLIDNGINKTGKEIKASYEINKKS